MRLLLSVLWVQIVMASCCAGEDRVPKRPVAILPLDGGAELLVADRVQGLFRVDVSSGKIQPVVQVDGHFNDLARVNDRTCVAVDNVSRRLLCLSHEAGDERLLYSLDLGLDPRKVAVSADETIACVTGRWSRAVQLLRFSSNGPPDAFARIDVGFECEEVLALSDGRFLVADGFGGYLAVIDPVEVRVDSRRELSGHHIGGLAMTDDRMAVLISHQRLSRVAHTDFDDIHWGNLIQNVVSQIPVEAFALSPRDFRRATATIQLGDTGQGFADPTGIVALPDGLAVLSGGAGQLLLVREGDVEGRYETGRRPTRLAKISSDRFIALNEHDGSLTIISVDGAIEPRIISLTSAAPVSAGETAFYDASLSHDRWMTCNSCHVDGHSPGLVADTFGDGAFGDPKRIPSLLGIADTEPFGWLGNKRSLEEQISTTLKTTMRGKSQSTEVTVPLVQFVTGLAVPDILDHWRDNTTGDTHDLREGRSVFESHKCNDCHGSRKFTSAVVRDVGMEDEFEKRMFNPPSLHGVRLRRRLFHDARAESLTDAFSKHRHQVPDDLSIDQIRNLVRYLQSL